MNVGGFKRRWMANSLAVASVLTTLAGVAMGWDSGGPGSSGPKNWNCTGAGCTTPPNDYRTCAANQSACCCYNSSTHTYTSACYTGADCGGQSGCTICS